MITKKVEYRWTKKFSSFCGKIFLPASVSTFGLVGVSGSPSSHQDSYCLLEGGTIYYDPLIDVSEISNLRIEE
jgi:hypothetical protein